MSDQLTTERLRELAAGATLYGHERDAMAAELLAKREECEALAYRAEDAENQLRCVTLTGDAVASDSSLYCGNSVRYWYDKAQAYKDSAGKLCEARKERDAARAEAKKYHDALVARHGGEPVALLSELDEARADLQAMTVEAMRAGRELAAVKRQREELIRAKTGKSPDDLFCCNGLECGCQGVTVGEYELYCVDRAIEAASQPAQQPKPEVQP